MVRATFLTSEGVPRGLCDSNLKRWPERRPFRSLRLRSESQSAFHESVRRRCIENLHPSQTHNLASIFVSESVKISLVVAAIRQQTLYRIRFQQNSQERQRLPVWRWLPLNHRKSMRRVSRLHTALDDQSCLKNAFFKRYRFPLEKLFFYLRCSNCIASCTNLCNLHTHRLARETLVANSLLARISSTQNFFLLPIQHFHEWYNNNPFNGAHKR